MSYTKVLFFALLGVLVISGVSVLAIDGAPNSEWGTRLIPFVRPIFGVHMFCWMVLGMMANYLWDLFKSGRTLSDIHIPDLLLPLLVSPIVFFGIWSLWPDKTVSFALNLVAFQNGFFWQVILSKAGPITKNP